MPVAAAVGIGSIAGGIMSSNASKKAAKTQAAASDRASQQTKEMYDQTRADLSPYTQAGVNSLGQLMQQMGTGGSLSKNYKGDNFSFNGSSTPYQSEAFKYNGSSDPYQSKAFNFEASPDYAFRKQQGMDGIQGSAAASGGLLSGATLKALNANNSNLASGEYGSAYNRYLQGEQLGQGQHQQAYNNYLANEQLGQGQYQQAFNNWQSNDNNQYNRFSADQNNQYSRLMGLINMGQSSAAQVGNAGAAAAQQIGNNTMAGADARAAGIIGSNNAYTNMIGQIGGLAGGALQSKANTGVWV